MWMRFYTQGKFSWRKKSLCTGMGGEGEIIVHNAALQVAEGHQPSAGARSRRP